ncbi:unnamed protein product [Arabidopsis lyrata]|nr:unnamed protein product [Arabidopsis lyrata]
MVRLCSRDERWWIKVVALFLVLRLASQAAEQASVCKSSQIAFFPVILVVSFVSLGFAVVASLLLGFIFSKISLGLTVAFWLVSAGVMGFTVSVVRFEDALLQHV